MLIVICEGLSLPLCINIRGGEKDPRGFFSVKGGVRVTGETGIYLTKCFVGRITERLQVWLQNFHQMVDHRSGGRSAGGSSGIDFFQHLCVSDCIIHIRQEDIKHICPVLIIDSQLFGLQTFGKLRTVCIPMEVCLQKHEME